MKTLLVSLFFLSQAHAGSLQQMLKQAQPAAKPKADSLVCAGVDYAYYKSLNLTCTLGKKTVTLARRPLFSSSDSESYGFDELHPIHTTRIFPISDLRGCDPKRLGDGVAARYAEELKDTLRRECSERFKKQLEVDFGESISIDQRKIELSVLKGQRMGAPDQEPEGEVPLAACHVGTTAIDAKAMVDSALGKCRRPSSVTE